MLAWSLLALGVAILLIGVVMTFRRSADANAATTIRLLGLELQMSGVGQGVVIAAFGLATVFLSAYISSNGFRDSSINQPKRASTDDFPKPKPEPQYKSLNQTIQLACNMSRNPERAAQKAQWVIRVGSRCVNEIRRAPEPSEIEATNFYICDLTNVGPKQVVNVGITLPIELHAEDRSTVGDLLDTIPIDIGVARLDPQETFSFILDNGSSNWGVVPLPKTASAQLPGEPPEQPTLILDPGQDSKVVIYPVTSR